MTKKVNALAIPNPKDPKLKIKGTFGLKNGSLNKIGRKVEEY